MNYNNTETKQNLYDESMDTDRTTYLLALEVEPMEVGRAYEQLPMHCTIMPRFHTALRPEELTDLLTLIFASAGPISLKALDHLAFGPKRQLVTQVKLSPEILKLHKALLKMLKEQKVQFAEAEWVGEGYVPHVTDKQGKRLSSVSPQKVETAYLISIEHPLKGHKRLILEKLAVK